MITIKYKKSNILCQQWHNDDVGQHFLNSKLAKQTLTQSVGDSDATPVYLFTCFSPNKWQYHNES